MNKNTISIYCIIIIFNNFMLNTACYGSGSPKILIYASGSLTIYLFLAVFVFVNAFNKHRLLCALLVLISFLLDLAWFVLFEGERLVRDCVLIMLPFITCVIVWQAWRISKKSGY